MNWLSLELFPKHEEPSHYFEFGEVKIGFMILSWYDNGESESRGIWRIKCIKLWMNQSCFSIGFLSQNSFGSSLHFVGIRVFIVGL